MELMNNLMSVYNNCKSTVPAGSISVADFLNKIRNEVFKKEIQKLRSIIDKKQRDAYKSSELKAVNYAGIFQERKNDLLTLCCNVIILDIDDVPNGKLKRLKAVIAKDEHTLAVWESPSGNGLKVMVKMYFGYSATTYKARYLCVLNYYASKFDIPIKDGRSSRNTATWGFDHSRISAS